MAKSFADVDNRITVANRRMARAQRDWNSNPTASNWARLKFLRAAQAQREIARIAWEAL